MNKFKLTGWILGIALITAFVGCKKDFDAPPGHELNTGQIITIDSLLNLFDQEGTINFDEDMSVFGVVTTDELTGNFYKEFYFQDETTGTALYVSLINAGGITEGDKVRINLNGTKLTIVNELLTLEEVDVDVHVFIQENLVDVTPLTITLDELDENVSKLVRIEGVQFVTSEMCQPFANGQADPPISFNRTIMDCNGNSIILRNSGYANFADAIMPSGNGTFVGILSKYNDDWQLKVRRPSDLDMDGERCNGEETIDCSSFYLSKNFEDFDVTSGGWSNYVVTGSYEWEHNDLGGGNYGQMSNYDSGNTASEAWLISPAVDLTESSAPYLIFKSAVAFDGPEMEVYVTTDYTSGDPNNVTWELLSPTFPPTGSFFEWTSSGNLDISSHISTSTRVAFKYIGSDSDGSTWEIDDIIITE